MSFFGIFYLISFILISCFATIEWGEKPANFVERIICSLLGSFVLTLFIGVWLYGIVCFFQNLL